MKYLLPLLLILAGSYCSAQNSLPADVRFNFVDVRGGLPEGFVFSMIQDRQGYVWMTTQRGLVRYDGYKPKVYTLGITDPYRMYIIKIFQDRKGRIWAGTWFGDLYLYDPDKDNFIAYSIVSTSSDSASGTILGNIEDDSLGRIWITVYGQNIESSFIVLFEPTTGKITRFGKHALGKNHIDESLYAIHEDRNGRIWMTASKGLFGFDNKSDRFVNQLGTADAVKQKGFIDITEDAVQPGMLWFTNALYFIGIASTTDKGLWRFDSAHDSATVFHHDPADVNSIASDTIFKVLNDAKGNLWIGTVSGISLFDRVKNNFINYYPSEKQEGLHNSVIDILQDKAGNFWCQSERGILYFDTQKRTFTRIVADPKKPAGLLTNEILHTFLLDQQGTLWLGVSNGGVQWINRQPSGFVQYDINGEASRHFPGGQVYGFDRDADGNIWIGAKHGLYRWENTTHSFTKIIFRKNKPEDKTGVYFPRVAKNGKVWFGVYTDNGTDAGLNCYDPRTGDIQYYRSIKNDTTSLSENSIMAVYEDHAGNIWVGTFSQGVCRFDPTTQKFIRYPFIRNTGGNTPNHGALDDAQVASIFEDRSHTIWVGTGGGLNRYNPQDGSFTSYKNILPGFQYITGIYEDSQNMLWVGSYFGGVFHFNPNTGKAEKFTEKDGLLYDGANVILEDSSRNLWLTSARGISIFNKETHKVRTLTTTNGLPVNNLNNFIYGLKLSNREFILSCDNGFIVLNPEDFRPDLVAPRVHIETISFSVPGKNLPQDSVIFAAGKKHIDLSYNENRLSFAYVGLLFQEAGLVQYAYQLEGYDKDWIPAGTQRSITYMNLSPGKYTFRVKAANSSGVWSTENPSITITIHPPWWLRWWAWLIYAVLFVAALWTFIAYRARHLKRANLVLEEKVSHRTRQLNKSIDDLKDTQKQLIQSEKMASLGELTAGIAHEIQNPLNFVNNFSEVSNELIDEMNTELDKGDIPGAKAIAVDISQNLEKINHHGRRADAIVKGMLQHSRKSSGEKEPTDINALADEYLRLSYHGLRAKDKMFNATLETDFDTNVGKINIVAQDMGRVLLNLFNNAFYAVNEKGKSSGDSYRPVVKVTTKKGNGEVEVIVEDNGNGIPQNIIDKIFQPFFTTKPTGEGTGLGLSLSYDTINVHGGKLKVETKEGEGTKFIIQLPS